SYSLLGSLPQHRRVRLEGNACGPVAWAIGTASLADPAGQAQLDQVAGTGRPDLAAEPPVHHRAGAGLPAPTGRRARLPLAVLVQRLVPVHPAHGGADAGSDPGVRLLDLPQAARATAQLRCCNDSATSDGPGRGGDDLCAGPA